MLFRSRDVFNGIYESAAWGSVETISGPGSTLASTETVRKTIVQLIRDKNIKSVLDIPCGDANWMRHVVRETGVDYIGADISEKLISKLKETFGGESSEINADRFRVLDITSDELPKADLVIVRDCLVHLSFDDIRKAIENLKRSGSKWLLATTFPGRSPHDIKAGQWRPIDMTCKEIGMPNPISVFAENCTEGDGAFKDKSLGLWKFN